MHAPRTAAGRSLFRSWPGFMLLALTVTFSIGFVDRQILNLLVEPIKTDLGLNDVQISLLQGTVFSVPYLLMSPVFGRWVDVFPRRRVLLWCTLVWAGCTAACGLAGSFGVLLAGRALVGAAEAGLTPAAWSMLGDRFDDSRLPRALSIYHLGTYVGSGAALLLGGLLMRWASDTEGPGAAIMAVMRPWQFTFVVVGALGLCALMLLALVREPERRGNAVGSEAERMELSAAWRVLWDRRRFYMPFYTGMSLAIMPVYVFPAWLPALAMRQYGAAISDVGLHYGAVSLVAGCLGVLSGPTFAKWLRHLGYTDVNLRLVAISAVGVLGCCVALWLRTSYEMVIAVGGIVAFFYAMPTPLAGAALQTVTPPPMRGLATGIYIVMITLVGLSLAPLSVAVLTESVFADPLRIGDSVAVVGGLAALGAAIAILLALPAYRARLGITGSTPKGRRG